MSCCPQDILLASLEELAYTLAGLDERATQDDPLGAVRRLLSSENEGAAGTGGTAGWPAPCHYGSMDRIIRLFIMPGVYIGSNDFIWGGWKSRHSRTGTPGVFLLTSGTCLVPLRKCLHDSREYLISHGIHDHTHLTDLRHLPSKNFAKKLRARLAQLP